MDKLKAKAFAEARILIKNKIVELKGSDLSEEQLETILEHKQDMIHSLAEKRYEKSVSGLNSKFKEKFPKGKKTPVLQVCKFEEEIGADSNLYHALIKKANVSGISLNVIGEVFSRGYNAWKEGMKVSPDQYAFARVNSYINEGRTYHEDDSDLHEEVLDESEKNPYVKPHFTYKNPNHQAGWVASNKHGKKQYFGLQFKSSAHKYAGLEESVELIKEDFKKGDNVYVTKKSETAHNTPIMGKIHNLTDTHAVLKVGTKFYKARREHISKDSKDSWTKVNEETDSPSKREIGTKSLVKSYKQDTPGENDSIEDVGDIDENTKSGELKPVMKPAYVDDHGNSIPAKTVMKKTGRKIIRSGNLFDGQMNLK